jgi:tRNA (guanine37-N1)-methyltransferase
LKGQGNPDNPLSFYAGIAVKITYCVKVRKADAEKAKQELRKRGFIDNSFDPRSDGDFILFPVTQQKTKGFRIVRVKVTERDMKPRSLEEALMQKGITSSQLTKSFDVIGDVAIIEVPTELEKQEKEIAKAVMLVHPNVKTVAKKTGPISGEYRVRKLKVIGGRKSTETLYRESGCLFKLDPSKVYFSPRLVFERQRIANLVKEDETVFVPFAGVGPFAIIIAKRHPTARVYANELNPAAVKYLQENIRLNGTFNVVPLGGDIRKVALKCQHVADRIVMPTPTNSEEFLDVAFMLAKKNTIIHFYKFSDSEKTAEEIVRKFAAKKRKRIKILGTRISREYAPSIVEVCVDFKVL